MAKICRSAYVIFLLGTALWLCAACSRKPLFVAETPAPLPTVEPTITPWVAPTLPPPTATATPRPPTSTPASRPPTSTPAPTAAVTSPAAAVASPTATAPAAPLTLPPTAAPTSAPQPVAVWEGTVTLNSYGWEQALVPTAPDDPVYPYPRLNRDAVAPPGPRSYTAVYIQNEYVQLIVLPELGGRILRWTDRTTGRQLFYANSVIKPTGWGYRGWWLATGGMEWAFPTEEHGLNEYRPWQHERLWNGVRVWDTDDRTGLRVEVTVQLAAGSSRVTVTPRISNPTAQAQPYQFWANAMLTLSDSNAPSPHLVFVLPASEVIVHSTGDGSLPGAGAAMSWPLYAGRDFSRYSEFRSWLGVFAPQAADAGFAAAYDLGADQGIVRTAPAWVRGVKLFCMGDLGSELWTDDGSRYFELWGGLTSSFWSYATLEPGAAVSWSEHWYAVSGMGGLSWANGEAAVRLAAAGDGVELAVETVRPQAVTVVLRQGGAEVARWQAEVGPGRPFRTAWGPGGGPWGVEVLDSAGGTLLRFGAT